MSENNSFLVFSGTKTRYLAEKICASLGCPLGNLVMTRFSDGEFVVSYEQSIRGKDVYLVQSTFPNSDNLMELLLMIDAAKRASARNIIAVIPYFGWARQDRKDKPRVSIGAKLVADLLSVAGIDRLITMDLHADQIQGALRCSCRSPVRKRCYVALSSGTEVKRLGDSQSRCWWLQTRKYICKIFRMSTCSLQQNTCTCKCCCQYADYW